LFSIYHI